MVSCFYCMQKLPSECKCKVSDETKTMRWIKAASSELELCSAMLKGYKPFAIFGKNKIQANEVIHEKGDFKVIFPPQRSKDWRYIKTMTLLDINGKPLYRWTRSSLGISLRRVDTFELRVVLGVGSK
jgi:hypothetical protein